jgi:arginine exporter protein ArgO
MVERKEIIKNVLIIFCVIILLGFLGGFVSAILDLGETAGIFLRTAGLLLLIFLGMKLFSKYYTKPLTQEMKEEESRETDQKEKKQLLFKPTIGA